jgi:hypothetical protein
MEFKILISLIVTLYINYLVHTGGKILTTASQQQLDTGQLRSFSSWQNNNMSYVLPAGCHHSSPSVMVAAVLKS